MLKNICLILITSSIGYSSNLENNPSNLEKNILDLNINAEEYTPMKYRNCNVNHNTSKVNYNISNKNFTHYTQYYNIINQSLYIQQLFFNNRMYINDTRIKFLINAKSNWGNKEIVLYNLNQFIDTLNKCEIYKIPLKKVLYLLSNSKEMLSAENNKYLETVMNTKKDLLMKKTNINQQKLTNTEKQIINNSIEDLTKKIMKNIYKVKKTFISEIKYNNIQYNFGINRYNFDRHSLLTEHILLDNNHIFEDIGDDSNGRNRRNGIYCIATDMPYYNEIHEIVKLAYDRQTNTILEDYKQQIYDIVKYCLVNPSINNFIRKIDSSYLINVSTNKYPVKNSIGLSITSNITNISPSIRLFLILQYDCTQTKNITNKYLYGFINSFFAMSTNHKNRVLTTLIYKK